MSYNLVKLKHKYIVLKKKVFVVPYRNVDGDKIDPGYLEAGTKYQVDRILPVAVRRYNGYRMFVRTETGAAVWVLIQSSNIADTNLSPTLFQLAEAFDHLLDILLKKNVEESQFQQAKKKVLLALGSKPVVEKSKSIITKPKRKSRIPLKVV